MWKKGKNLVYLYEKSSILSIGGARLIFMNSYKYLHKLKSEGLKCCLFLIGSIHTKIWQFVYIF